MHTAEHDKQRPYYNSLACRPRNSRHKCLYLVPLYVSAFGRRVKVCLHSNGPVAFRTRALFNAQHTIEQPGILQLSQKRCHPLSASGTELLVPTHRGFTCSQERQLDEGTHREQSSTDRALPKLEQEALIGLG
jgi:hypothetical protein